MNRIGYLQTLCNKYGNFFVCKSSLNENGDPVFSKHYSVMELWHFDSGLKFLEGANNRTSLVCELILDIDQNPSIKKVNEICDKLENHYQFKFVAFKSGGKGYHVHVFIPEFVNFESRYSREKRRRFLIKKFNCDIMKASEKSMIALEFCPHWRTEKIKEIVRCGGWDLKQ